MSDQPVSDFEKATASQDSDMMLTEIWNFLRVTKKWWLLPIIIVFLLFGVMMLMSGSAVAPFIYTLF
jgi:hypothetical protein